MSLARGGSGRSSCDKLKQLYTRKLGPEERSLPRCRFGCVNPGNGGGRRETSGCNHHLGRGATCWGIASLAVVRVRQLGRRLTGFERLFSTLADLAPKRPELGTGRCGIFSHAELTDIAYTYYKN